MARSRLRRRPASADGSLSRMRRAVACLGAAALLVAAPAVSVPAWADSPAGTAPTTTTQETAATSQSEVPAATSPAGTSPAGTDPDAPSSPVLPAPVTPSSPPVTTTDPSASLPTAASVDGGPTSASSSPAGPPGAPSTSSGSTGSSPSGRALAAEEHLGTVTAGPATGSRSSTITLTVDPGLRCPTGTAKVLAVVRTGPGDWKGGDVKLNAYPVPDASDDFQFTLDGGQFFTAATDGGDRVPLLDGAYDVVLWCLNGEGDQILGSFDGLTFWWADTASPNPYYLTTDPATTQVPVEVAVTTTPVNVVELAQSVTLTATLNRKSATGTVQFRDRLTSGATVDVGSPQPVSEGKASLSTSTLEFGLHYLTAVLTAGPGFQDAVSDELAVGVVKPQPPIPPPSQVTVTGTPRVDAVLTCNSGTFVGASSLGYQWYRDLYPISDGTARTYTPVAGDVGHLIACRGTGTMTVASIDITAGRLSDGVLVTP